jgi:3-hydroxyisobutyrate dehydrogenase-like beta-hydroxyacid dehydrogenase
MAATPARPAVGFIGLGRIGRPIAGRLVDAGFALVAYDIDPRACEALAGRASIATSPADVADRSDVVVACLQTTGQYEAAVVGERGVVHGKRAKTYVHVGTTGRASVLALAGRLAERGIATVDAPMSGGVAGAKAGTLVSMVAGPREACERIAPLLEAYSRRVVRLGDEPGLAQAMKLVNNMLSAANLVFAAHVMVVGAKAGLAVDTMLDVLNHGTGQNSATLTKIPDNVVPRTFDVGSTLANGIKDLAAFRDEAERAGASTALCDAVLACFEAAIRQGSAADDFGTVVRPFERAAGVELKRAG